VEVGVSGARQLARIDESTPSGRFLKTISNVTAEAWHQLGRLVERDGERDVSAQSLGQA